MEIKRRINVKPSSTNRASTPRGRRAQKVTSKKSTAVKGTKFHFPRIMACTTATLLLSLCTPTSTNESSSSTTIKVETNVQVDSKQSSTTPDSQEVVVSDSPYWNCSGLPFQECNETDYWEHAGSNNTGNNQYRQLYDVPVHLVVLLSLLYGLISVAAVIGNILVLWVVTVSLALLLFFIFLTLLLS